MQPTSVALTPEGNVLVGDTGNARVQTLTSAGLPVRSFPVPPGSGFDGATLHVAAGLGGDIWVGQGGFSGSTDTLRRYDENGTLLGAWGSDTSASPPGKMIGVNGVGVDVGGNVYTVADDLSPGGWQQVIKQSPTGAFLDAWPLRTGAGESAYGRALAASGNVIAVIAVGSDLQRPDLVRFDPDGNVLSRWPIGNAVSLALDGAGNVYTVLNQTIEKYSPDGKLLGTFDAWPPAPERPADGCAAQPFIESGAQHPPTFTSLAVDAGGGIYATDLVDRIVSVDATPEVRLASGPSFGIGPVLTGQIIALDAGLSTVPFGSPTRFEWDLDGDGTFETDGGADAKRSFAYSVAGSRSVGVRVTGSNGSSAAARKTFVVLDSEATLWGTPVTVTGAPAAFNAGPELGCSTASFQWDLDGDGTFETQTGSTNRVTRTYNEVGAITVRVRVIRPGGRVDEAAVRHETRPAPPPGPVGVTINDGAHFTNNPVVRVNSIWPSLTKDIVVANDGGFSGSKTIPIAPAVTWKLRSSGPERLPKTIYVRFSRPGVVSQSDATFTDDIILDETNPLVTRADILDHPAGDASVSGPRAVRLLVRARDNLSGVSRMQVTAKRKRPGKWRRVRRISRHRTSADALWVRVRDKAGNKSRWRLAR